MRTRGAALVETIFVMSIMLTIFFGALQFGIVGYSQLAVDGASYLDARRQAVNGNVATDGAADARSSTVQNAFANRFAPTAANEDYTGMPQALPSSMPGNLYVSMIRSAPVYTHESPSGVARFVMIGASPLLGVNGSAIDGQNRITAPAYNVGGVFHGTGPSAYDEDTTGAPSAGSDWLSNAKGYGNVFPAFAAIATTHYCDQHVVFYNGPDCLYPHLHLRTFGLAEYIDSTDSGENFGFNNGDVFGDMPCHEAYYARLANNLFTANAFDVDFTSPDIAPGGKFDETNPANTDLYTVYSWDVPDVADEGGSIGGTFGPNAFNSRNGC